MIIKQNTPVWTIIEGEVQRAVVMDSYPIYVEDIGTCYKIEWNGRILYKFWKYLFESEKALKSHIYFKKVKKQYE